MLLRKIAAVAATMLAGSDCAGVASAAGAPPRAPLWIASLRYEDAPLHLSLSNPAPKYLYIDAGTANGIYPSPDVFSAEIEVANPGLLAGSCSKLTHMSATTKQFADPRGFQAPSYLLFFTPRSAGTCTQRINLGAEGVRSFSVTVSA
jgi:hypothetical protein